MNEEVDAVVKKRRINHAVRIAAVLLLLGATYLSGVRIERGVWKNVELVGVVADAGIKYGDYVATGDTLRQVVGEPGDVMTYEKQLLRNGEPTGVYTSMSPTELKGYLLYDGEAYEQVESAPRFIPLNENVGTMALSMLVVAVVICFALKP